MRLQKQISLSKQSKRLQEKKSKNIPQERSWKAWNNWYPRRQTHHWHTADDIILMLIHQFITFGFACTPPYFVWEKVIGMHDTKSICLRALARFPVVIPIWFLAIIFPFFGPINSTVGALLVSFIIYIIPAMATYSLFLCRQRWHCH